jgi:hypothetical protein
MNLSERQRSLTALRRLRQGGAEWHEKSKFLSVFGAFGLEYANCRDAGNLGMASHF